MYPEGARSSPPELNRTRHTPLLSGRIVQRCPQAKHRTRSPLERHSSKISLFLLRFETSAAESGDGRLAPPLARGEGTGTCRVLASKKTRGKGRPAGGRWYRLTRGRRTNAQWIRRRCGEDRIQGAQDPLFEPSLRSFDGPSITRERYDYDELAVAILVNH